MAMPGQQAPANRPPPNPNVATGGKPQATGLDAVSSRDLETNADIEVTYKKTSAIVGTSRSTRRWLLSRESRR